jgi:hypothetical protein
MEGRGMAEYYFAIFGLGVDEDGNPCDAYVKMTVDCEIPEVFAVSFVEKQFPDFKGRIRRMSYDEYIELAGDEEG